MRKCLFIIFQFLFICFRVSANEFTVITLDITNNSVKNLSEIFGCADLIQLKSDNMIVPDIEQLYIDNNCIVIKGSNYKNQYLFKRDGSYITDLGQKFFFDAQIYEKYKANQYYRFVTIYETYKHKYYTENVFVYVNRNEGLVTALPEFNPFELSSTFTNKGKKYNKDVNAELEGFVIINDKVNKSFIDSDTYYTHSKESNIIYYNDSRNGEVRPVYKLEFKTNPNEKAVILSSFINNNTLIVKYQLYEVIHNFDIIKGVYYSVYNLENGDQYSNIESEGVLNDTDVRLLGTCDDGFVFAVDNPWNAKITDTGNEILTKKGKKNFCAINESSDYMLLIMRPY